jgi:hypothetical protein
MKGAHAALGRVPVVKDLSKLIFENSIKITEPNAQEMIYVTLSAEWTQRNEGLFDICDSIAALFPHGIISSLNAEFGKCRNNVKKSGYTILENSFNLITPPSTGILNIYPVHTPPVSVGFGRTAKVITLPRYWFRGTWRIAWDYEQKRVEHLSFSIPFHPAGGQTLDISQPQPLGDDAHTSMRERYEIYMKAQGIEEIHPAGGQTLDASQPQPLGDDGAHASMRERYEICMKVQGIEEIEGWAQSAATLGESVWLKIANYAIANIKLELATKFQASISFSVPFEVGADMEFGDAVEFELSGSIITGTVSEIICVAEGVSRKAHVTIKVTPDWLREWLWATHRVCELSSTKLEGLVTETLNEADAIADVSIENDAESQITKILQVKFSSEKELADFLGENETQILVRLKNLQTKKCLENFITARIITS